VARLRLKPIAASIQLYGGHRKLPACDRDLLRAVAGQMSVASVFPALPSAMLAVELLFIQHFQYRPSTA